MASTKPKILIQLDTDSQASVFDAVVAIDAGVDHLLRHGGVTPANVRDLVYGALFTRAPADLQATAIFVGGSDVASGEAVLEAVRGTFFGPFKVSVLFDANGANTTAAAAVLAALQGSGGSLEGVAAGVMAATGPVGQRSGPAALPAGGESGRRVAQSRPRAGRCGSPPQSHGRSRDRVRRDQRDGTDRGIQRYVCHHLRGGGGRSAPPRVGLAKLAGAQDPDRLERGSAPGHRRG